MLQKVQRQKLSGTPGDSRPNFGNHNLRNKLTHVEMLSQEVLVFVLSDHCRPYNLVNFLVQSRANWYVS